MPDESQEQVFKASAQEIGRVVHEMAAEVFAHARRLCGDDQQLIYGVMATAFKYADMNMEIAFKEARGKIAGQTRAREIAAQLKTEEPKA